MFKAIWLLNAALTAFGILFDLRRLIAGRIRAVRVAWIVLGSLAGPVACAVYLGVRRRIRRKLVDAVWRIAGGCRHPAAVRAKRLNTLHECGLIGPKVFRACMRAIEDSPHDGVLDHE